MKNKLCILKWWEEIWKINSMKSAEIGRKIPKNSTICRWLNEYYDELNRKHEQTIWRIDNLILWEIKLIVNRCKKNSIVTRLNKRIINNRIDFILHTVRQMHSKLKIQLLVKVLSLKIESFPIIGREWTRPRKRILF